MGAERHLAIDGLVIVVKTAIRPLSVRPCPMSGTGLPSKYAKIPMVAPKVTTLKQQAAISFPQPSEDKMSFAVCIRGVLDCSFAAEAGAGNVEDKPLDVPCEGLEVPTAPPNSRRSAFRRPDKPGAMTPVGAS